MAVITRFIVVRNGVELDKVFEIKKEADAYDHMLDAAEKLAGLIRQGSLQLDLDQKTVDAVSIHLAKNAPEVTKILKGIKTFALGAPAGGKPDKAVNAPSVEAKPATGGKSGLRRKEK